LGILLDFLVGGLTLGLPLWFAFLDQRVFPRLKWTGEGDPVPPWGHLVVVVGVLLVIFVALSAPVSGFEPNH